MAMAKAKANHVAVVAAVQVHHIGRLGEYAEMAAAENLTALIWGGGYSEVAPAAVPYGGRQRALHTNPLAMGLPAGADCLGSQADGIAAVIGNGGLIRRDNKDVVAANDKLPGRLLRSGRAA